MASHSRPHSHVPAAQASTDTSVDELIRPGLRLAYPLPPRGDLPEERFRRVLAALAQRQPPGRAAPSPLG